MNDPYDIILENEEHLEEFIAYQVAYKPTDDFRRFATLSTAAEEIFKCAAILYPKFILVEDQVVLADHYSEENWRAWRSQCSARDSANVVNHSHIGGLLVRVQERSPLEDGLGQLLAFFWQLAVDHQFPERHIEVSFDGDVIHILNP